MGEFKGIGDSSGATPVEAAAIAENTTHATSDGDDHSKVQKQLTGPWDTPVFFDLEPDGLIVDSGPGAPDVEVFIGEVLLEAYSPSAVEHKTFNFHVPHTIKKGSVPTLHLHCAHNIASPTGTGVRWKTTWHAARGYGVDAFSAGVVGEATFTVEGQYTHSIFGDDVLPMPAALAANIEPDMFIFVHVERDFSHAEDDFAHDIFMWRADLHCEAEREGTAERNRPWTSAGY